jgi:NAD(P)-dependent dehydrogenase (short-subunit alcohol dehydrogenase family)
MYNRSMNNALVLITGCDSGIGRCLCDAFLAVGYPVLASCLKPELLPDREGLTKVALELADAASVQAFAQRASLMTGEGKPSLGCVILNAGISATGPVETLPMETMRRVFEVNFFGNVALIQALLPLIRRDRGRLCLISSAAGRIAPPFFSPYVCSKFALEGLGDCLRRELSGLGVRTIIFEPRAIVTPIWQNTWGVTEREVLPATGEEYRKRMVKGATRLLNGAAVGMSAAAAAAFILRKATARRPAPRYIVSRKRAVVAIQFLLPARVVDLVMGLIFRNESRPRSN